MGTIAWMALTPSDVATSSGFVNLVNVPITIPSGAAYARINFGYSRFIGPSQAPTVFECTLRADGCLTNTVSTGPFAFASETSTPTSGCSSGCTINIPVSGPNVVYYRVDRSSDGSTWTDGDVQVFTISGASVATVSGNFVAPAGMVLPAGFVP